MNLIMIGIVNVLTDSKMLLMDIVIQNVTGTMEKPLMMVTLVNVTQITISLRTLMVYVFKYVLIIITITTKMLMNTDIVLNLVLTIATIGTMIHMVCVL